jgi:exoribonuclease II
VILSVILEIFCIIGKKFLEKYMKEFLKSIANGVNLGEISGKKREIIDVLLKFKAVCEYNKKYYLNDGFIIGKLDVAFNGTGYLSAFDANFNHDLIIENRDIKNASCDDIVLAKITGKRRAKFHAKVLCALVLANKASVFVTKKFNHEILGVNVKSGFATRLNASQKSLKLLPLGAVLLVENSEITQVLGVIDDPKVDEKISLSLFARRDEFDEICQNLSLSFDEPSIYFYPDRRDLREFDFCTIDPVDAKDFDDAIYYDKNLHEIYVAIADVSEYVSEYSALDKVAKERGFSIYFPHKSVPMLPRNLSENICSLKPNNDRLAFVFRMKLNQNGEILENELFSAIIRSKRRFNYDEIDEILARNLDTQINPNFSEIDKKIISWLKPLSSICAKFREKRLQNGFEFNTPELRLNLDEKGGIKSTKFEYESPSHKLVEDCMLMANLCAAKYLKVGVFRNHTRADVKKIYSLLDDLSVLGIDAVYENDMPKMVAKIQTQARNLGIGEEVDKLIIKAQRRAEYGSKSAGHFALGFENYTHFTSPIRRYSDLFLHRLLKAKLSKDEKYFRYLCKDLDEICAKLNELERETDKIAWDFIDRKFARWAQANLGRNVRCYISENENVVVAKMDDKIKGGRIFITNFTNEILTKILVEITQVDLISAKIYGRVVKKI